MCLPVKPYKIEREWESSGLKCAVVQARERGHRCGYVRVPPTHPMYGMDYDAPNVEVHGGLTFATEEDCIEEDGKGWWFGFDCAHCGDASYEPGSPMAERYGNFPDEVFRSQAYVERETEYLARQLSGVDGREK